MIRRKLSTGELTVGIPLHESGKWLPVIRENLSALNGNARVIVSDVDERDDTLERLSDEFTGVQDFEFVGRRKLASGWAHHCNDLKSRAKTDYFMWLPHDDSIGSDWVLAGIHALNQNPTASIAFGPMILHNEGTGAETELVFQSDNARLDARERLVESFRRQFVTRHPAFGHAFRGVQRQALTGFLPTEGSPDIDRAPDWKADVFWAANALARGPFVPTTAVYWKRDGMESASSAWLSENLTPGFRQQLLRSIDCLTLEDRYAIAVALWDDEAMRYRLALNAAKARIEKL